MSYLAVARFLSEGVSTDLHYSCVVLISFETRLYFVFAFLEKPVGVQLYVDDQDEGQEVAII